MKIAPVALCALLFLASCGTTLGDRAVTGAGIGAGAGALVGGVGAVPGALIGAGVAVATPPQNVNLGPPPWRD